MSETASRDTVLTVARRMVALGLSHGTTGNVSVRTASGFLITPSGVPYDVMTPRDIVPLGADGVPAAGSGVPSSEWRIHRDIYAARPDAGAVVHAHPTFSTTIACLRRDLPAVHYMLAIAGGAPVRCAEYATFGTPALSAAVLRALTDRKACLLANHGLVALGADAAGALRVAEEVERVAELYWRSLAVGEPTFLDPAEMERVAKRFESYGKP